MPESGLKPSLEPGVVKLVSHLTDHPRLRLPGSLTQGDALASTRPDADARRARSDYLSGLISKDPGVFLERHGELLSATDLNLFDRLRDDYEVNFYLRQLEQQLESHVEIVQLSSQTKNRRLAQLNRLIDEGTYFEDSAMRSRAPLLHHQYVGQYRLQKDLAATAASGNLPTDRGGHPLSDSVMAGLEEAQTQRKLTQQQAAQDQIEQESSDEDDWPEDRRAEMQQTPADEQSYDLPQVQRESEKCSPAATKQCAVRLHTGQDTARLGSSVHPSSSVSDGKSPDSAEDAQPEAVSLKHLEATRGESRTAALLLAHAERGASVSDTTKDDIGQNPLHPSAPSFVHIPVEEQTQLQSDFLLLMHQRFLSGEEEDVDYRIIDADQGLDDDLAGQIGQDAEDAYFDAD